MYLPTYTYSHDIQDSVQTGVISTDHIIGFYYRYEPNYIRNFVVCANASTAVTYQVSKGLTEDQAITYVSTLSTALFSTNLYDTLPELLI